MKTDDLIALLATRAGAERRPATGAALVRAVCVGLLGSLAIVLVGYGLTTGFRRCWACPCSG